MEPLKSAAKLRKKGVKPQSVSEGRVTVWACELDRIEIVSRERNKGSRVGVAGRLGLSFWRLIASFVKKGRVAYISYEALAKMLKASVSAVQEAAQRLVRIGALVIIPQYDWVDGKWVRRPNVYEIRRPRFEARFMPLFKRIRGVKQAAKELVQDVRKSFRRVSDVSETRGSPPGYIKPSVSTASSSGAPAARTVFSSSGASAMPPRRLGSEEGGKRSRLEAALARLERSIVGKNAEA